MKLVCYWLALIVACNVVPLHAHGAAARPAVCDRTRAEATSIEAIRSNYAAWRGKCVALRGIGIGVRLHADRLAMLEPGQAYDEAIRQSIIMYPQRGRRFGRRPRMLEVVGRIGSCAEANEVVGAMQANDPTQIYLTAGYCHTSSETYIRPVSIRLISSQPILRVVEAEVPEGQRELVEAPAGIYGLAAHLTVARALAAALATGDEATFLRLTRPEVHHQIERIGVSPMPEWLQRDRREVRARFAGMGDLRRRFAANFARGAPEERALVERSELPTDEREAAMPGAFVVCWCTAGDCRGRWPIAKFDADNLKRRPYLCITTGEYILGPGAGTAMIADVTVASEGLAEPVWANSGG